MCFPAALHSFLSAGTRNYHYTQQACLCRKHRKSRRLDDVAVTCRYEFQLETMKNGQIIDTFSLAEKSCFKFGRSPACDVVLEHPSSSRLHAVIQFREENGLPYLYDAASVHGVLINKRKIKPRAYVPLK